MYLTKILFIQKYWHIYLLVYIKEIFHQFTMNFQEQLKYDKLQKLQERLQTNWVQSWAKAIVQTIQTDVSDTIIVKQEAIKKSEIAGLDAENYGAPPENSGIAAYKNGTKLPYTSRTEPQAFEDDKWYWCYNHPGAVQLAKILGRTLPDTNQLVIAIDANPDNFRQNGSLYQGAHIFWVKTSFCSKNSSIFLSSSEELWGDPYSVSLDNDSLSARIVFSTHRSTWSIRFIVDKK